MVKQCLSCEVEFDGHPTAKFCCSACRSKYKRRTGVEKSKTRICTICNTEFYINHPSQKICSDNCRKKANIRDTKAWIERNAKG